MYLYSLTASVTVFFFFFIKVRPAFSKREQSIKKIEHSEGKLEVDYEMLQIINMFIYYAGS